jgi:tetratricopeptide (TPR) repeat protein
MSCHNTLPGFVEGSENKFSSIPEGVSCERCHGPGSIHVQQRSTGSKIDTSKYIDYSIVNPGKLSIERQFDVCQRCHLQGNAVLKEGKSFFDFRPGMTLSDYMTVFLPRYKGADKQFIMASHADRLKQSKCFIRSMETNSDTSALRPYKNALTCVTCHNPHVSVKVTGKEVFNNACKNCHNTTTHNGLCSEKEELRNKVQDNCVSCHMPRSGAIDIPHVTVHDHFIRKPMKEEEVAKVKEFIGLYAINEKNPSALTKAKAYIQQYDKFEYNTVFLDSAEALLKSKSISGKKQNFELSVHLYFMKNNYAAILAAVKSAGIDYISSTFVHKSWDNSDAWTLYRIGESYYNSSDPANAFTFYKKADELAPYNPEFRNKLGVSLMALNRIPEAVNVFESVLKENPKFVPALTNLGYANVVGGKAKEAGAYYKRALALDPDYEPLLMNMAGLKIYEQNYKEAITILEKVLKKNPQNEQAKGVLLKLKSLN